MGGWVGIESGFGKTQHGLDSIERGVGGALFLCSWFGCFRAGDRFLSPVLLNLVNFFRRFFSRQEELGEVFSRPCLTMSRCFVRTLYLSFPFLSLFPAGGEGKKCYCPPRISFSNPGGGAGG